MSTYYYLFCKTCDQEQDDGWKVDDQIALIWENRFLLKHVETILWSFQSGIYQEECTIDFAIKHREHEVILKDEYGKKFNFFGHQFKEIVETPVKSKKKKSP